MINRSYIWVDGPPGGGKTSLIERILKSNRTRLIMAARFAPTDSVSEPVEVFQGNDETERYLMAGASNTLLYKYPVVRHDETEERFWDTVFIQDDSDAIIFEGPPRREIRPDLFVYVTRPLADGENLVTRKEVEMVRLDFKAYLSAILGEELTEEEFEEQEDDSSFDTDMEDEEELEEVPIPDEIADKLQEYVEHGVPIMQEKWTLNDTQQGLAHAQVVVINIFDEEERRAAEVLTREIHRMYEDESIRDDVVRSYGRRRPSVFVANFDDPKDEGLKKAIARIKRAFTG
ncbi:MAG: hypothetical protein HY788_15335 [Deltaproteobacteria bacterium]|nr:hypothetical protein [Deltaproteobacteria bacterium]